MDWIQNIGDQHPWITLAISALSSGVIGFVFGLISDRAIKLLYRPHLKLQFDNSDDYQTPTPDKRGRKTFKAYVFRAKVTNTKRGTLAKGCRAYLVGIEELHNGQFVRTAFTDCILLSWSTRQSRARKGAEFEPVDLPKGVGQYVDVFAIRQGVDHFEPCTSITPFRYKDLYKKKGTLRFTFRIGGENFDPVDGAIVFEWPKKWEKGETKANFVATKGAGCVGDGE